MRHISTSQIKPFPASLSNRGRKNITLTAIQCPNSNSQQIGTGTITLQPATIQNGRHSDQWYGPAKTKDPVFSYYRKSLWICEFTIHHSYQIHFPTNFWITIVFMQLPSLVKIT